MTHIRILEAVSGADFSWQPGDIVDLGEEEAAAWADGHRAERVEGGPASAADGPGEPPMVFTADGVELSILDAKLVDDSSRWAVTVAWPEEAEVEDMPAYDPDEHVAREVLAYLADVGEEEAVRVLDAEAAGQNRTGIAKERDQVLARARANDEARTAAELENTEVAAEASHGGDLRDGIETR